MGWFSEHGSALNAALGAKRYMLVPITGAIVGSFGWVISRLAEASLESLIGVPSWAVGIFAGLLLATYWIFEYAVQLKRHLTPKLEASFNPGSGGVSVTTLTERAPGTFAEPVKYVRLAVKTTSRKSVRECVAKLVRIEHRLESERTETLWDQDALPLTWSVTGGYETTVDDLTKRYVDVGRVLKNLGRFEILTVIPNRLAPGLKKTGTFLLTVVVTGDGVSSDAIIEIETDGTYDGFKARAV